jgi:hypothetical protein
MLALASLVERDALHDLETVPHQTDQTSRVVGEQPQPTYPEVAQHLCPEPVLPRSPSGRPAVAAMGELFSSPKGGFRAAISARRSLLGGR